jgi:hypothetical protein
LKIERAVQNTARFLLATIVSGITAGTRARTFFIIFVDAIFTTLLEPLFTNAPDVIGAKLMKSCVCRPRHAD